jgi:DNA-binding GntR family transcriptional regulator
MIEITEMNDDAASILKTANGAPVLLLHRLLVASDGSPMAYTRLMGGGRKYKLRTELVQIV